MQGFVKFRSRRAEFSGQPSRSGAAAPAAEPLDPQSLSPMPRNFHVLGIKVDNISMSEAIADVVSHAANPAAEPRQMCFVNAHCANVAYKDAEYAGILQRAARVFADGVGVRLAAKANGVSVIDNVNGTDMFPPLCADLEKAGIGVYLLGAKPGIVDGVAAWLRLNYPGLQIKGARDGFFQASEDHAVAEAVRASGAQLLLVAMGVPRQEKWIEDNLARCGVKVAIGVGALFDFYAQAVPRAPMWMRKNGLEWAYRLYVEPRRMWKRYVVGNPRFMFRVMREHNKLLWAVHLAAKTLSRPLSLFAR